MKKLISLLQILLVLSLATPFTTNARNLTWTGSSSGNWNDSANFSPMFVPTANDTVTIDAATHHPRLTSNASAYRLVLLGDTLDLNGYQLNIANEALFSGGWLVDGQLNCRGTIATFAGTVINVTVDVDCTTLELNGSVFNQSCYFKAETGDSQGGNTFMSPVSLVHVGIVASISMAVDQGDTFHDSLHVTNTSDGNIHLTQTDTSYFKSCVQLSSTGDGSIHFGREGGISVLETNGHLVVENGEFTSGQLFIKNIEQQNATGHRIVLTGTGGSDEHSLLALENGHFTGDVDFTAPNLLLSINRFDGEVLLTKTGGYDNVSTGDNLFNQNASFTNSSSTGHLLLTGSREDRFLGTAQFTSGSTKIIAGYGATAIFEGDVVVNAATVGFYRLKFTGEAEQTLSGTTGHLYGETELDKASGSVTATIPIAIDRRLTFTKGYLLTDSVNLVTFLASGSASGATDSSFVSGPVKKVGNTAFEFPVGDNDGEAFLPVEISAPQNITDAYTAQLFFTRQLLGNDTESHIAYLSECNYWNLERNTGSSKVVAKFSWDGNVCSIMDTNSLTLVHWENDEWVDNGNGFMGGDFDSGQLSASDSIDSFGYFIFAYIDNADTLMDSHGFGFIKNVGQFVDVELYPINDISFQFSFGNVKHYFSNNKVSHVFNVNSDSIEIDSLFRADMIFYGSDSTRAPSGRLLVQTKTNYLLSYLDSFIVDVPGYKEIVYDSIYSNIDLIFNSKNGLGIQFKIYPGGDANDIDIGFEGINDIIIDEQNRLTIETAAGLIEYDIIEAYVDSSGILIPVEIDYDVNDGRISFDIGPYYSGGILIINFGPAISPLPNSTFGKLYWSTYVQDNTNSYGLSDVYYDNATNSIYTVSAPYSSGFPTTQGVWQSQSAGFQDLLIIKFDGNRGLEWATFLGSAAPEMNPLGITKHSNGNLIINGSTGAGNVFPFPSYPCTGCYAGTLGEHFVSEITNNGKFLIWSSLVDMRIKDVVCDHIGNIYVGGYTYVSTANPFVYLPGAYNATFGTGSNNFWEPLLAKFNINRDLIWFTSIGGNDENMAWGPTDYELINSLAIDSKGQLYVLGHTFSDGVILNNPPVYQTVNGQFPLVDPGGNSTVFGYQFTGDDFIVKFNANNAIVWSTMLGSGDRERANFQNVIEPENKHCIAVDQSENIYVVGSTVGSGNSWWMPFPIVNSGNQDGHDEDDNQGGADMYIAKFTKFPQDRYQLTYSTLYGGSGDDEANAISVDNKGNIYITGTTNSPDFPVEPPPGNIASDGTYYQDTFGGWFDAYLIKITKPLKHVLGTYFGGVGIEFGQVVTSNKAGNSVIMAGVAAQSSSGFTFATPIGGLAYTCTTANSGAFVTNFVNVCSGCRFVEDDAEETNLLNSEDGIVIYPNPGTGSFIIEHDGVGKMMKVTVTEMTGKYSFVFNGSSHSNELKLDLSSYPNGIYFVNVLTETNSKNVKVVKQN